MNDTQLLSKLSLVRQGDRMAFEDIFNDMKTPLYTVILRIVQNPATAEELLQELFLKLFKSPPEPSIKKPRSYLFRMARNLAIDSVKKQPQTDSLDLRDDLTDSRADGKIELMDLNAALCALSLEERQIIVLHLNGGLKFREIAQITSMPLGTVLWKYRRGIDRLRSLLDGGEI